MTYEDFIEGRQKGTVVAGIDRSVAYKLVDSLPKRYQVSIVFWSWIWVLSIPVFILVTVFVHWLVGILLLVFVTPTISSGTKNSAVQFVLELAERDKEYFEKLVERNLLVFKVNC